MSTNTKLRPYLEVNQCELLLGILRDKPLADYKDPYVAQETANVLSAVIERHYTRFNNSISRGELKWEDFSSYTPKKKKEDVIDKGSFGGDILAIQSACLAKVLDSHIESLTDFEKESAINKLIAAEALTEADINDTFIKGGVDKVLSDYKMGVNPSNPSYLK